MVSMTFTGYEMCEWRTNTVTVDGEPDEDGVGEIQSCEIRYNGRKELFKANFNLIEFEEGAIPLGCYAFPFHYTLQHGLPSSLSKRTVRDEDQGMTYKGGIYYEITAELVGSTMSPRDLTTTTCFEVKNEDVFIAFDSDERPKKNVTESIPSCFCFPRGEISLEVELDSVSYTLGDNISALVRIENTSSATITSGSVKLIKIMIMYGYEVTDEDQKPNGQISRVINTLQDLQQEFDLGPKSDLSREVKIPVEETNGESLPSTEGVIMKCRYHVEAVVKVPQGGEISLILPIIVFPKPAKQWITWNRPIWLNSVEIKDASGICSVPRYLLDSKEFMHVPLSPGTRV